MGGIGWLLWHRVIFWHYIITVTKENYVFGSNRPVACKTSGIFFNYVMSLLDYYVAPPTNTFPMGGNSSSQLNL